MKQMRDLDSVEMFSGEKRVWVFWGRAQNTLLHFRVEAIFIVVQGFTIFQVLYHVNMLYSPIFAMGNAFGKFFNYPFCSVYDCFSATTQVMFEKSDCRFPSKISLT